MSPEVRCRRDNDNDSEKRQLQRQSLDNDLPIEKTMDFNMKVRCESESDVTPDDLEVPLPELEDVPFDRNLSQKSSANSGTF